jgi:hypothetical protein
LIITRARGRTTDGETHASSRSSWNLGLHHRDEAKLCNARHDEHRAADEHGDGREHLHADKVARVEVEEGAADGGAYEHAEAAEAEAHADARSDIAEVRGERDERGRLQRGERAGEEAVEDREGDEGAGAVHCSPRDEERAAHEGTRDDGVKCACAVRKRGGCETAEERGGVEDGHEVEGERRARAGLGEREGCDIEEGVVEADEAEADPQCAEDEGRLTKRRDVEEFAARRRQDALAREDIGDDERDENDETDHASRPTKADPRL